MRVRDEPILAGWTPPAWRRRETLPILVGAGTGGGIGPTLRDVVGYWWSLVITLVIMTMVMAAGVVIQRILDARRQVRRSAAGLGDR
jgi:hypothetical protein